MKEVAQSIALHHHFRHHFIRRRGVCGMRRITLPIFTVHHSAAHKAADFPRNLKRIVSSRIINEKNDDELV